MGMDKQESTSGFVTGASWKAYATRNPITEVLPWLSINESANWCHSVTCQGKFFPIINKPVTPACDTDAQGPSLATRCHSRWFNLINLHRIGADSVHHAGPLFSGYIVILGLSALVTIT